MKRKSISWEKTRNLYVNWLSKTKLKYHFSKHIKYENLSLWWLTSLLEKDNLNDSTWFKNLHNIFNGNYVKINQHLYVIGFFYKLIKKLILQIIIIVYVKILFKNKNNFSKKKKNCIHATCNNLKNYGSRYAIDRQYGLFGLKEKRDQIYFIEFSGNLNSIKNYFNIKRKLDKIPFEYCISEKFISLWEIIKIYFFTLSNFFVLLKILKKKNFFIINDKNCEEILKKRLLLSFFGPIQEQLIRGLSLRNFLENSSYTNFITCFDFHPGARVLYFFAKNSKVKNVININHANYSENNIFFNFNNSDFSMKINSGGIFSPRPDFYFCQGKKYFYKLKKIFKNKTRQIGSLKCELEKPIKLKAVKNINKKNIFKNNKKILLILCSLHDYESFIKLLNKCDLSNFNIIVLPHPLEIEKTLECFNKNFKKDFFNGGKLIKTELLKSSDYIIFGDTSLGLELSIMNKNIFRLYDPEFIPTFDLNNEVPTATNEFMIKNFLKQKKIKQKSKLIEKLYFYKYDRKGSQRFKNLISKI